MLTRLLVILIRGYQYAVSPMLGTHCRFTPSCSAYAVEAFTRFGLVRGGWLAAKRLACCHPWHSGGCDPVPKYESTKFP